MRYVIYDTNEYYGMVGNSNRSFQDIAHTIDELRENEQRKDLVPIFNSTVAFELINRLCTEDTESQDRYIRACYALYYHCRESLPVVTKNPIATYIENTFCTKGFPFERTIKFLECLYNNPTLENLGRNVCIIRDISNVVQHCQRSYLRDLQSVRELFELREEEHQKAKETQVRDKYFTWKTLTFLAGVVQTCTFERIEVNEKFVNENTIQAFIEEHRTYLEISHRFDNIYVAGGFDLSNPKTANTFWDAEICYHLGTKINGNDVGVVTEEKQLHEAAQLAGQENLMLFRKQIYE